MHVITNTKEDKGGVKLTAAELQLVRDLRRLNDEVRAIYSDAIHRTAERVSPSRPVLRLVAG